MKEVLLLGDSIRMAYQKRVTELLGGEFHVSAPGENCRFAAYTLNSLRMWLPKLPKPDIIHWNNGLWDTAILYPEDGCFTHLGEYADALEKILRELQKTGAKIVFASSTPVSPEKEFLTTAAPPAHKNEDIRRYNAAARIIMEQNGIEINDLYQLVEPHISEYISADMIHPTPAGVEALAAAVSNKIKEVSHD
ncbi:MAG: SGNH/GDSL hydrolase family protein [Clostridia bacterium]|nr:SGNH/GDSL hydrolase family protein [Clostridia bacterium]